MKLLAAAALMSAFASPVVAEVTISFRDGAPKDRFVISSSLGLCTEAPAEVTIDMTPSVGRLIFDVTEAGGGVAVFQPFELVVGGDVVTGASDVVDGDKVLTLTLSSLMAGAEVAFTIDVDDTIGAREITVTGSEISGAVVTVRADDEVSRGVFAENGLAFVDWPSCLS